MTYNDLTQRYFGADERVGSLTGPAVTRGSAGSRARGAWVQFDLQWQAHSSTGALRLKDARFLAFGCPHTIAVAAWLAERAVAEAYAGTGLPEPVPAIARRFAVPVEKLGRLLLVEDAWQAATLGNEAGRQTPESRGNCMK